jgi:predicted outer membrane repeat protein
VIEGNTATSDGGGVYSFADVTIDGSSITGNHAGGAGGGLYLGAQGFLSSVATTTFYENSASDGGAIYNTLAFIGLDLTDVIISGNRASALGGGIYNLGSVDAAGSQIFGNSAVSGGGGGIYDDDSQFAGTTTLTTSVVRKNEPDNCEPAGSINGCVG